jgi:hypothetical protein
MVNLIEIGHITLTLMLMLRLRYTCTQFYSKSYRGTSRLIEWSGKEYRSENGSYPDTYVK